MHLLLQFFFVMRETLCRVFLSIIKQILSTHLKTFAANFHVHKSCVGKQEKVSGSCLSTIYKLRSIQFSDSLLSDGCFHIFLTK